MLWLPGCVYTLKFAPLPVVLSWGGVTPDGKLVMGGDAGVQLEVSR